MTEPVAPADAEPTLKKEETPALAEATAESPLSLKRLTQAFAAMMGRPAETTASSDVPLAARTPTTTTSLDVPVNVRTITEAILFVGRPNNQPLSAETLAATMRDVSPQEVVAAVAELNASYDEEGAAYTISESAGGFRLVLREEWERVRDKFYGRVRQATLSPKAMEVLAIVAYRQPVSLAELDALRNQSSQSLASQLVRRGLLRLERPGENPKQPLYWTTERFLKIFQLSSLDQLPKAEEFDLSFPVESPL